MNIGYFRVSKEDEKIQDLDSQIKAIKDKFEVKDLVVFKERGSAYDLNKIKNRVEFRKVLSILFDSEEITLDDLFFGNIKRKDINFYVWDYHRIIRHLEYNLLFGLCCYFFNVTIYSHKQGVIERNPDDIPTKRFVAVIMDSANAFDSEQYSWNISENVKKSVNIEKGITVSKEGKKWGRKFKDLSGKNKSLSVKQIVSLRRRINFMLDNSYSQKEIILDIEKRFKIKISNAYISKTKNGQTQ